MPIYDIVCKACNFQGEILVFDNTSTPPCPSCGSLETQKLISPTSSLSGRASHAFPGPADTACCGQSPGTAGCSGPGSCCGKRI
jgi:putative FmdB family regulatory protein